MIILQEQESLGSLDKTDDEVALTHRICASLLSAWESLSTGKYFLLLRHCYLTKMILIYANYNLFLAQQKCPYAFCYPQLCSLKTSVAQLYRFAHCACRDGRNTMLENKKSQLLFKSKL